jgi:hypothetical protein
MVEEGNSVLAEGEVLSLPGVKNSIELRRGLRLMLWGLIPGNGGPVPLYESSIVIHENPTVDVDLTINRGRVCISSVNARSQALVCLRVHNRLWQLELDPGTEIVVELTASARPGFEKSRQESLPPRAVLGFFVLTGQATLKDGKRSFALEKPPGPAMYLWTSDLGSSAGPLPLVSIPEWLDRDMPVSAGVTRIVHQLRGKLAGGTPVENAVHGLVEEMDPTVVKYGIHCLAALGDIPGLIEKSNSQGSRECRIAAIDGLRHWVSQDRTNDVALFAALTKKFGSGPAEIVMHLIHGFSENARNVPETYDHLIEYLLSDKLIIRELASRNLDTMPETRSIAKTIPYESGGGVGHRIAAYDKWKQAIPDGKMPKAAADSGRK